MNSHNQEEFLLKWNDHHNSFFTIMQDLCATEMLTDVTLACGGEVFETHKLMLCVCSTFFRQILTRRPDKQPIVFLKDVNPRHLEMLLQYMYNGEVNVLQEDLGPLIETARSLQVKGLADAPAQNKRPPPPPHVAAPPPLKKARTTPSMTSAAHNSLKPSPLVTSHLANRLTQPLRPQPPQQQPLHPKDEAVEPPELESHDSWSGEPAESQDPDASVDSEVYPDHDAQGDDDQFSHDQGYDNEGFVDSGLMGGKPYRLSGSGSTGTKSVSGAPARRHACPQCGKAFVTPSKLQRHVLSHSGIRPFHCQLCGRHFSQAANLKTHIRNTHTDEDPSVIAALSAAVAPIHATAYATSDNPLDDELSPDL